MAEKTDYVLVHSRDGSEDRQNEETRNMFEDALRKERFTIGEPVVIGDKVFKKLHCQFERLCEEAEQVKLEMPLEGCEVSTLEPWPMETDNEEDYKSISAPFKNDKRKKFKGHENEETFFRPSLRGLLTDLILINIKISGKGELKVTPALPDTKGLKSLLDDKVYDSAFILHEDSCISLKTKCICSKETDEEKEIRLSEDPRKEMEDTWWTKKLWQFQPLWKIRNYFGEKIALYFAWAGLLFASLLVPALFGLACFFYGLSISVDRFNTDTQAPTNLTNADLFRWQLKNLYEIVRGSFDNNATPWFALVICLWGTVFLELWKRKNAVLAYKWHVVNYEANEPDRPKNFRTSQIRQYCREFPLWIIPSIIVVLFVGLISILAVAWVRLFILIRYCGDTPTMECFLSSIIIPGLANAVFIFFTDLFYDRLAKKLTHLENHDTQTEYDDALIFKLFAFQFANNYAYCFYVAFLRGEIDVFGLLGLGEEYFDECYGESCISQLSILVITLMISKPLGKFFVDIIWPALKDCICPIKNAVNKIKHCCGKCETQVNDEENGNQIIPFIIQRNYSKVPVDDFTLGEYAEKVTLYGFLMLFATASPLAPMIAVVWLAADMALDVQRLLWLTRRPVAHIAQDIGSWYDVLNFVNVLGVISNGFLIAFKSQWGLQFDLTTRLWICIGFQNIVFALKFFLDYIIPDVPKDVTRAMRRDKSTVSKKMKA